MRRIQVYNKERIKMAKITLKDSVNENEIVNSDKVVNEPNILLEESDESGYGIIGKYGDYSLVVKKIAYRSITDEDNFDKKYKVVKYATWVEYPCYNGTLLGIINDWIAKRNLSKIKALKKADFSKVEEILNETKSIVEKAMNNIDVSDNEKQSAIQSDNYNALLNKTKRIKEIIKEADSLHELVKEKRKIVIKDTEPKKHRTPKDSE